jgi:hypothetical protein
MNLREHPSASSDNLINTIVIGVVTEREVHIAYLEISLRPRSAFPRPSNDFQAVGCTPGNIGTILGPQIATNPRALGKPQSTNPQGLAGCLKLLASTD